MTDVAGRFRGSVGVAELLRLGITLATFGLIFSIIEPRAVAQAFSDVVWLWILLRTVPFVLGLLFQALRWRLLLADMGILAPLGLLFRRTWIASFFANTLPGKIGGDAFRILEPLGVPASRTHIASSVLLDRFLGLLGLFLMVVMVGLPALAMDPAPVLRVPTVMGLLGCAAGVPWLLSPAPARFVRRQIRHLPAGRLKRLIETFLEGLAACSERPSSTLRALFLGVLFNLSVTIGSYFGFLALEVEVPLHAVILLVPIINLVCLIPISLNGLGLREASFAAAFSMVGIPGAESVAVALVGRATGLALSGLGGPLYLAERRRLRRGAGKTREASQA